MIEYIICIALTLLIALPGLGETTSAPGAFCRGGQVFLTWQEIPTATEGYSISEINGSQTREVARVPQGSGIDIIAKRIAKKNKKDEPARGYILRPGGKPLPEGTGLWIHTVKKAGTVSYLITAINGPEIGRINIQEKPGTPEPVLENIHKIRKDRISRNYIHWGTPEMGLRDGIPYKFAVQTGPDFAAKTKHPLFMLLHGWTAVYTQVPPLDEEGIALIPDDYTYGLPLPTDGNDWWFGYSNHIGGDLKNSTIQNYTEKRLLYELNWAMNNFDIDRDRVYLRGGSMGGTGAISMGFRYPELFAAIDSVVPRIDPAIGIRRSAFEQVWGKLEWGLKTNEGDNIWDNRNLIHLAKTLHKDLPFLKNLSGRTDQTIDWETVPPFYRALQQNRLGFIGLWSNGGHGTARNGAPNEYKRFQISRFRRNESYPAISNLTANNNPGNGDRKDGDLIGMMNAGFDWEKIVDTPTRWEITLLPIDQSVRNSCLDLTPRRLQKMQVKPDQRYRFKNTDNKTGRLLQEGIIKPDQWKSLIIQKLEVVPDGNHIIIEAVK